MDWNFATTLIGSLPFKDAETALDAVTKGGVDCPAWPQLAALGFSEGMYVQTGCKLPGIRIDDAAKKIFVDLNDYDPTETYIAILEDDVDHFECPKENYAGLYGLLVRDLSGYKAVKGQVTGAISEGLQVQDATGRSVIYDEAYCEIVRKTVNLTAKWQARKLAEKNPNVIMFFDEPSLSLLGSPFASISDKDAVEWINDSLNGVDCYRAIHCCGNTNWQLVLKTNIDILSFDAYNYGHTVLMFPDELSDFLQKGGCLAWGIVPSSEELLETENVDSLVERLESLFDMVESKGIDRKKAARQSMITPQCGIGGISEASVVKVLALLKGVSETMRSRYDLK